MEKSLIIKGPFPDMADLLMVARETGQKALRVNKVKVKPFIAPYGEGDYLVVVEEDVGCSKTAGVAGRQK